MKRFFLAAMTLLTTAVVTTSCMKDSGGVNYPQPVDPAVEKPKIDAFIKAKGFTMTEFNNTGILYEVVKNENNNGWGDTTSFRPSDKEKPWITVSYKGTLLDDKVFDSTKTGETRNFQIYGMLPNGNMGPLLITSFYEMVKKIGKGGHIRFVTPSKYAYSNEGNLANMPLFFDISLVDVSDKKTQQ